MMLHGGDRRYEKKSREDAGWTALSGETEKNKKAPQRAAVVWNRCGGDCRGISGSGGRKREKETAAVPEREVYASELAGFLQAAYLTPEETRTLVIPKVQEVLTVDDLRRICNVLGMERCYEEAVAHLQNSFPTIADTSAQKKELVLSREQWCMYYELLLDKLQVKDTVAEVELQYLGKVPGEQRIMADNGNYDCDLQAAGWNMENGMWYMCRERYCLGSSRKWHRTLKMTEKCPKQHRSRKRHQCGVNHGSGYGTCPADTGSRTEAGAFRGLCDGEYRMESVCCRRGGGGCGRNSGRLWRVDGAEWSG